MALDLFKFLRRKRKTKKNYDPSKIMDSTEYLKGAKNTRVEIGKPESRIAAIGRADPELGVDEGAIKPLGGLEKPKQDLRKFDIQNPNDGGLTSVSRNVRAEKPDVALFRDRLKTIKDKRKTAAEERYNKQIKARNKRAGSKKPRSAEERQKEYDLAFRRPLGENTMLGRASANREQRQIDMKKFYEDSKKKREAAKKKKIIK